MKIKSALLITTALMVFGCNNKPKVIEATNTETNNVSDAFTVTGLDPKTGSESLSVSNEYHSVLVKEVLPTSKYVYLNVTENGDEPYWVATRSMKVNVGETYYYKGGLLKTNFESKEYNRVFEKIYLVSNLVSAKKHGSDGTNRTTTTDYLETPLHEKQAIEMHTEKVVHKTGSIKISELVKNPKKYEGQTVQLDGICTKINAGIMNRNWIHIKDGSKDDYDLVLTSDVYIPEGAMFSMEAVVVLDKDFGSGYKYDLILEQGKVIK